MAIAAFDSITYVHKLEQAGISRGQAEALAQEMFALVNSRTTAMKKLEDDLQKEIQNVRDEMWKTNQSLRNEILNDKLERALKLEKKNDMIMWCTPRIMALAAFIMWILVLLRK